MRESRCRHLKQVFYSSDCQKEKEKRESWKLWILFFILRTEREKHESNFNQVLRHLSVGKLFFFLFSPHSFSISSSPRPWNARPWHDKDEPKKQIFFYFFYFLYLFSLFPLFPLSASSGTGSSRTNKFCLKVKLLTNSNSRASSLRPYFSYENTGCAYLDGRRLLHNAAITGHYGLPQNLNSTNWNLEVLRSWILTGDGSWGTNTSKPAEEQLTVSKSSGSKEPGVVGGFSCLWSATGLLWVDSRSVVRIRTTAKPHSLVTL